MISRYSSTGGRWTSRRFDIAGFFEPQVHEIDVRQFPQCGGDETTIDFEAYRRKYLKFMPEGEIKYLLIAESPPNQTREAPWFFYYDEDDAQALGGLFEHTMRARYEERWRNLRWIGRDASASKRALLERFSSEGFYLIDETDELIAGVSKVKKRQALQRVIDSKSLARTIANLANESYLTTATKVAFISCMGYDRLFNHLSTSSVLIDKNEVKLKELLMEVRVPMPFGNDDNVRQFKMFVGALRTSVERRG